MLRGERTRDYVTPEGSAVGVCELCKQRAEGSGWARADMPPPDRPTREAQMPRRRRGGAEGVLGRVRERAARSLAAIGAPAGSAESSGDRSAPAEGRLAKAAPRTESGPERRLRRALEGFNSSDRRRKVTGLTRSLGEPRAAAVPTGVPTDGAVRITVAWDLCWYQWEVRVTDRGMAVREVASGDEIEQLPEVDRAWNLRASDDGSLSFGVGR